MPTCCMYILSHVHGILIEKTVAFRQIGSAADLDKFIYTALPKFGKSMTSFQEYRCQLLSL